MATGTKNPAQWLIDWITGGTSVAGVKVTPQSALKYTPFWAAVRIISGTLASLPFVVYERLDNSGKQRQQKHKVYEFMHSRPNPYMDAMTLIETRQAHVLTYGNGYAEIQRTGGGVPVHLWPLLPDRTTRMISPAGVPYYEIRLPDGSTTTLPDYNVLHIKGLGFDGYTGYNVVDYHKTAIGYGVAVKEYGARFFSQDASPGGVLECPNALSDQAYSRMVKSWNAKHEGLSMAHRLQILEEGTKFSAMGIDPQKAQALEVQKYTVDDCCRIFNMPPHKLASMEHATFSNIEEQNIDFNTGTMLYWYKKWESEINFKLFMPSERQRLFVEILADAVLRGDTKTRYEAYNIGRNGGWLSSDDIREKENMNPLPDGKGKIYLEPLNMKPAGSESTSPDARSAQLLDSLRMVISEQFKRVITKRNGSGYKADQIDFCRKVLFGPVLSYAIAMGRPQHRAYEALSEASVEFLQQDTKLTSDHAERFAGRLTDLLNQQGDSHVEPH
jgi:HK97 family phage portal protein